MRAISIALVAGMSCGLNFLGTTPARGDDYFTNTSGGDWNIDANWSNNIPIHHDDVYLGYDHGGVTFTNPSSLTVTLNGNQSLVGSIRSKVNLNLVAGTDPSSSEILVAGSLIEFDPGVGIVLGVQPGAQSSTAAMFTSNTLTLNANITQGAYSVFSPSAPTTYGAGYVWNITSGVSSGLGFSHRMLDSGRSAFTLNGALNLSGGATAIFADLTIGATGQWTGDTGVFNAITVNNQGALSLSGVGNSRVNGDITNGGTLSIKNGAVFEQLPISGGMANATNSGSITVEGAGTRALFKNLSGAGSISATSGAELDLDGFSTALLDHATLDSSTIVQVGGTITTPAGETFDFTRLGDHVSFGIIHGASGADNGDVSFSGGSVIHSDQITHVRSLTDVTLDHGLTIDLKPVARETDFNGVINAGDRAISIDPGEKLILAGGATLNGDVHLLGGGDLNTFVLGGTLNGNITVDGSAELDLGAAARATSAISLANGATLAATAQDGHLLTGSNLDLSKATTLAIGNYTFDSGSTVKIGRGIEVYSAWTNAGTLTLADGALFVPFNTTAQTITNSGAMNLPAGATFHGWADSQLLPIASDGTFTIDGHWNDAPTAERTVSNSGVLTISAAGEVDQWAYSQSAGKTLVNGLLYFAPDNASNPLGAATITGGELGGAGSIQRYAVNITGATLRAGDAGQPGVLSFIDSTLNLGQGAILQSQIMDTAHFGKFMFSGTGDAVTLGGTLDVGLLGGAIIAYGDTFTILTADSIRGTFDALNIPAGWQVSYTPTSVVVSAVPEPEELEALALAPLILLRRRRHRAARRDDARLA